METSRILALRGVHVIMGIRNLSTGTDVKESILKETPNAKVDIVELDLSSMASVRKFVADFNSLGLPLNILINNAGVLMLPFTLSKDAIELHFATNHIDLLLENMKTIAQKSGTEGRIVNISSDGYLYTYREGIRFDEINDKEGYNGFCAYRQSKLANIFHAQELAIRLKEGVEEGAGTNQRPQGTVLVARVLGEVAGRRTMTRNTTVRRGRIKFISASHPKRGILGNHSSEDWACASVLVGCIKFNIACI